MRSTVVGTLAVASVLVWGAVGCASSQKSGAGGGAAAAAPVHASATAVSADDAWRRLEDGNNRFATGHGRAVADYSSRRAELAKGQQPFAVIVSCSDSRAGPEVIFDQGLGDLFVIRTAGHVVDDEALGSIEYAVEHLGSPLIVVLGHSRCGAVTAAVEGGSAPGHIGAVVKAIRPAVEETRGQPGDPVDNAMRANVRDVARQLRESQPILAELVHEGKVRVVGARYDLDSGRVERVE
jgi:carbonic anhydrase